MESYIRWWLKSMKWFLVFFAPITCAIMLALPIWTSLFPWDRATERLYEMDPSTIAIQIAGASSSQGKFKSRSATYILIPNTFSSFKAIIYHEEQNNGISKEEIIESSGALIGNILFIAALMLTTVFWSIPTIKTAIRNGIN